MKIRIIVVDDQKLFLESLATVLESFVDDIEVVGKASSGPEAIAIAEERVPDIALIDIRMPIMNGIETAKHIRTRNPNIKVILLTTFDDDEYIKQAMSIGVSGYILKDIEPSDLLNYLLVVHAGATIFHSSVAEKLQNKLGDRKTEIWDPELDIRKILLQSLTMQEKKILRYIVDGFSNNEISDKLCISRQTVQNYVSVIYSKLDVHDRMKVLRVYKDFEEWGT